MDDGVLPTVACRVIDHNGKLRWLAEVDGERAKYDRDPNSTWLQRLTARIVQMLPVHEQSEKSTDRGCARAGRYLRRGPAALPAGKSGTGRVRGQTLLDVMWAAPGFHRRSLAGNVPMKLLRVENLNEAEKYTSESDLYGSGMLQHDHDVGLVLEFLKANGLDQNTIILYSTDNGPEHSSWPHGGATPFRGEKMSTYEGGVRVISMLQWPGVIKPGQVLNGIQGHQDMFTSLAAAAGVPNVVETMKRDKRQYIDGVSNLNYWTGKSAESARDHIFYYYESKLTAVRMGPWKFHFSTKENYYANVVPLTVPLVFNLRMDPFESYDSSDSYGHLMQKVSWLIQPMGELMNAHLNSLAEYPTVQGGKSFDMSNVVEQFIDKAIQ
jgi:hypothetical protein